MNYEIRKIEYEDIEKFVDLNIECFKQTYKGILSNEYLNDFEYKKNELIKEEQSVFYQDSDLIYLLIIDNELAGYLCVGKSKIKNYLNDGEIKSLYLLNKYQGNGYGKILFNFGIKCLKEMNYNNICIGCLKDNIKANMFYSHMGCLLIDYHETVTGNTKMIENIYIYDI